MSLHCMLSDEPGTDFVEDSRVVRKRAWMFALNAVGLQGLTFRMLSRKISRTGLPSMRSVGASMPPLCSSERTRIALLILPRDMKSLNILRSQCCCLFLEFNLIWIAFASQNSSEKLQLYHACSLRLMVLLFDPSSVFFVRLRVRCGSIIQRVRDISDLSVFTAIGERTLWRASANCSPVLFLPSVKNEGFQVTTSRLEVVPKIIRCCGDGTFGGVRCCRIYECSVGNDQKWDSWRMDPIIEMRFRRMDPIRSIRLNPIRDSLEMRFRRMDPIIGNSTKLKHQYFEDVLLGCIQKEFLQFRRMSSAWDLFCKAFWTDCVGDPL